jgi:teichuronic acid biosynthesis glycosyltransferase TuaC
MKILIVCSGNAPGFDFQKHQAFIYDQVLAVKQELPEIQFEFFFIKGKGLWGYFNTRKPLIDVLYRHNPDVIHAHFSLSGLLATLQRRVPVVITFHGSDINILSNRIVSFIAELLSRHTIYVSHTLLRKAFFASPKKSSVIPCGVDSTIFKPCDKTEARKKLNLDTGKTYILFSSAFNVKVKNYPLARDAVALLNSNGTQLLEFSGYTRNEAALLYSAADVALMTSFSEGSPQFIKEAMACNCPIVTTDVGDARDVIGDTDGCYITTYSPEDVAEKLRLALKFGRTNGREKIRHLDNRRIAEKIVEVYRSV